VGRREEGATSENKRRRAETTPRVDAPLVSGQPAFSASIDMRNHWMWKSGVDHSQIWIHCA
jgi:hypothetical protein